MKVKDLRQLTGEELGLELERIQKHLFDLRSQAVTEKLEDPTMLTKAKRDMARILTVQREREIAAAVGAQGSSPAGQTAQAKA
jgi:large subunit ribosomal protein L29